MDLNELLKLLDLEAPEEFEYFENFADLVESDDEIPEETIYMLFSRVNRSAVVDIILHYFEEIMESMPDDSTDMYTLLENIKRALIGLLKSRGEEDCIVYFAQELYKFKQWYTNDSVVECSRLDGSEKKELHLIDALVLARVEQLESDEYRYDFSQCLEYELEDYVMDLADIAGSQDTCEDDNLLSSGYLYEDDMKKG